MHCCVTFTRHIEISSRRLRHVNFGLAKPVLVGRNDLLIGFPIVTFMAKDYRIREALRIEASSIENPVVRTYYL